MKLSALYDRATEAHAAIMTTRTRAEAIRSFKEACKNPETPIHQNPSDYELWELGEYNEETGEITPNKERLARAEDIVGDKA